MPETCRMTGSFNILGLVKLPSCFANCWHDHQALENWSSRNSKDAKKNGTNKAIFVHGFLRIHLFCQVRGSHFCLNIFHPNPSRLGLEYQILRSSFRPFQPPKGIQIFKSFYDFFRLELKYNQLSNTGTVFEQYSPFSIFFQHILDVQTPQPLEVHHVAIRVHPGRRPSAAEERKWLGKADQNAVAVLWTHGCPLKRKVFDLESILPIFWDAFLHSMFEIFHMFFPLI